MVPFIPAIHLTGWEYILIPAVIKLSYRPNGWPIWEMPNERYHSNLTKTNILIRWIEIGSSHHRKPWSWGNGRWPLVREIPVQNPVAAYQIGTVVPLMSASRYENQRLSWFSYWLYLTPPVSHNGHFGRYERYQFRTLYDVSDLKKLQKLKIRRK